MLSKIASDKFFEGTFGKIFPRQLVDHLEDLRSQTDAAELNQKMTFDSMAEDGETIIEVTLTLRVKGAEIEE